jgi:hypothetical protein
MQSQTLLAMTLKRAEISECIPLLEVRSRQRRGLAINRLIESLHRRGDWLDRRIEMELKEADPAERSRIAKILSAQDAESVVRRLEQALSRKAYRRHIHVIKNYDVNMTHTPEHAS